MIIYIEVIQFVQKTNEKEFLLGNVFTYEMAYYDHSIFYCGKNTNIYRYNTKNKQITILNDQIAFDGKGCSITFNEIDNSLYVATPYSDRITKLLYDDNSNTAEIIDTIEISYNNITNIELLSMDIVSNNDLLFINFKEAGQNSYIATLAKETNKLNVVNMLDSNITSISFTSSPFDNRYYYATTTILNDDDKMEISVYNQQYDINDDKSINIDQYTAKIYSKESDDFDFDDHMAGFISLDANTKYDEDVIYAATSTGSVIAINFDLDQCHHVTTFNLIDHEHNNHQYVVRDLIIYDKNPLEKHFSSCGTCLNTSNHIPYLYEFLAGIAFIGTAILFYKVISHFCDKNKSEIDYSDLIDEPSYYEAPSIQKIDYNYEV